MATIKFGKNQFANPTPRKVSNRIDIFTVIAGVLITWMGTSAANFIPANVSSGLQSILSLLLTIAQAIKPFYGVETSQKDVPIENVGEMDTDPKPDLSAIKPSAPNDTSIQHKP